MSHFIVQLLIFIAPSVLLVPIFQRLGLGSVLGYLMAGIIVGPHGLGFIKEPHSVLHFAELGVVFLLFIIGLEIQPKKLKNMWRSLLGLGAMQVILSTLIFMGIGVFSSLSPLAAGVLGFGLSLSSTAFAIQALSEKNELGTEHGEGAFSVLLMQDLLAIPALAIIPALSGGSGSSMKVWVYIPVLIVGLSLISRFLMRPIFRMIASTRSRDMFTAIALFIVLSVAAMMEKIGLSAALGAFVAGVLLADSEYRHELESNLGPFKGLLMGLFFIAVGMEVNLKLIFESPLAIFFLTLVYMLIKWSILYGVGRFMKQQHQTAKLMANSIVQGGEFAFVIFGIVATTKLVDDYRLALLTVVITFSMALSPLIELISAFFDRRKTEEKLEPLYDEIKGEEAKIIIAGFGRFGQIFGRILRAQGIPFVAIDHDPDHIEVVRRFGNKVYYGDVSRLDLLESAGANRAKYLILAIDDTETSLEVTKMVKEHFPHLKLYVRARNRGHVFDLMDLGVDHIKRETFDSSLSFSAELLKDIGFDAKHVEQIIQRFKEHDELMIQDQHRVHKNEKEMIHVSQESQAQLMQVFEAESQKSYIKLNS